MNTNEVLATLAAERLGEKVQPNDDVNETLMPAIGADRPLFRSSNMVVVSAPVFIESITPLIE